MHKKIIVLILLVVGICLSQQVSGDSLLKMLERAKLYYNSGEYERAIRELESALQYLKQLNKNEQVEAYKYLAFSYVAFGDRERAKEQFKKALSLDPNLELDPATVSPKIIKVFEEAKAETVITPPQPPQVQPQPIKPAKPEIQPRKPSTTGALMRSCCLPGWGQIYKGENSKGKRLLISAAIAFPTTLIASSITEVKHKKYLEVEPDNESEMDQAYREYRFWYNVSAFAWLTSISIYCYNIYDVLFTKPATKSSMENNLNQILYCDLGIDNLRLGINFKF